MEKDEPKETSIGTPSLYGVVEEEQESAAFGAFGDDETQSSGPLQLLSSHWECHLVMDLPQGCDRAAVQVVES